MAIHKLDLERVLNTIRMATPGSSDANIKQRLFDVLDEFCRDSLAWRETLSVPVLAGTTTGNVNTNCNYTLTPTEGYIFQLIGAYDSNLFTIGAFMPNEDGGPFAVGQFVMNNPVNSNQTISVVVAKTVIAQQMSRDVPIFSETLFRNFWRPIQFGVIGYLQGEMNKPYTDNAKAQANIQRFRHGVNEARTLAERQNTVGAQAWAFPRGWGTRGQRGGVSTGNPTRF